MTQKKIAPDDHIANIEHFLNVFRSRLLPRGVIHIGAHQGEEVESYFRAGFKDIILIEANPTWAKFLEEKFGNDKRIKVFNCAVTERTGIIQLQVHSSRSGSTEPASILPLKEFKKIVSTLKTDQVIDVPAYTLDDLFQEHGVAASNYNLLSVDVQGAEASVFRGAQKTLPAMDAVLTEVCVIELYEGALLEKELLGMLNAKGFDEVDSLYHELYDQNGRFPAWGESLLIRKDLMKSR